MGLEQAVDGRFRDEVALGIGKHHRQFPRRQLRFIEGQVHDPAADIVGDAVPDPAGTTGTVFKAGFAEGPVAIGIGLSDAHRDYSLGWRLAEARPAGLAFGLDVEGARRERASGDGRPEHRLGLGLAWRLEGAGAGRFELRFEGARLDGAANDNAEHRLGGRLTVGW